ncbi:hypothetical protein BH11ACT8_BH11ACT8_28610 [soil metagenome]
MSRSRIVELLTALVLLGSALSLVLALTRPDQEPVENRPGESTPYVAADLAGPGGPALAAAVSGLPALLSYDFRDLDGSLKAARATLTASYAKEFTTLFDRRSRPVARKRKAVTEAVVRAAGLVTTRGVDRAVCLVFIDQQLVQSTRLAPGDPAETLSRNRVRVTLVRRSGKWKISKIAPL